MPNVVFVSSDGAETVVELSVGRSLMEGARDGGIAGIAAECGGACACATCHVHVAPDWLERVGKAEDLEEEMLEFAGDVDATSRLSCQITMRDDLDGVTVHVPAP